MRQPNRKTLDGQPMSEQSVSPLGQELLKNLEAKRKAAYQDGRAKYQQQNSGADNEIAFITIYVDHTVTPRANIVR